MTLQNMGGPDGSESNEAARAREKQSPPPSTITLRQATPMTDEQPDKNAIRSAYDAIRAQNPWKHPASDILHHRVLPHATLAPWLNDEAFLALYEKVKAHTLVDLYRCYELWVLAGQTAKIEGAILEVGVWRGGTGAILAQASKPAGKTVYLADTFTGVVKAGAHDPTYRGGEHADTSQALVAKLLASLSLENVRLLEGVFPDDTQHLVTDRIAMLHCDVDVYASSRDIVQWCLPRMSVGSLLVFDDYGFHGCEGVTTYCNELRQRDDLVFTHNLNGHAVFVKIA
jgi:O-methyltransferase